MPTYEYRREDGTTFEIWQRITDEPLEECPETGQKVERLISGGAGLVFKGEGFYVTDYARKENGAKETTNGASSNGEKTESTESTAEK